MSIERSTNEPLRTADVLLIEHSPEYAALAAHAIRDAAPKTSIEIVTNSEQALYYLFRAGMYAHRDQSSPRIVLLNVAIPGVGSVQVLERIRNDRVGCAIPVVVTSFTDEPELVRQVLSRGANSFVRVPLDPQDYMSLVRQLAIYWLQVNITSVGPK